MTSLFAKIPVTLRTVRAALLLALVYVISGKLALVLALPPGYATAIFPPAGVAMAAIMAGGSSLLPGVFVGALTLNILLGLHADFSLSLTSLLAAITVAVSSTVQAWLGSLMLRRWVRPGLDASRDVVRFLLLAPMMCLTSASLAIPIFFYLHLIPFDSLLANWQTWWVGDTIGVLLAAPLAWIFIGQPRSLWHKRRWLLIVPLTVSSVVFIAGYQKASGWEQDQQLQTFQLKSQQVGIILQSKFEEHEHLLLTIASVLRHSDAITAIQLQDMAQVYLTHRPEIRSMSWAPLVTLNDRVKFEHWARTHVSHDYFIKQFDANKLPQPAASRAQYFPITYIEPLTNNARVQGYDLLSEPIRAASLRAAIQSSKPAASAMITLAHKDGSKKGILLSQQIKLSHGKAVDTPTGILTMAIQVEPYLEHAIAQVKFPNLLVKLEDITSADVKNVLVDNIQRPLRAGDYQRELAFGGRHYQLTLTPTDAYLAAHHGWQSWTALVSGFLMIGLLTAFLLLMSGQRAQIDNIVTDRTRKLQDREARLKAILNNAPDAILTINRNGMVISGNGAALILFDYPEHELTGLSFDHLIRLEGGESAIGLLHRLSLPLKVHVEIIGCKMDGQPVPLSITVSLVDESEETFFVCTLRDLTEQRRSQEQIYELAHHDPLTGLANRFALGQQLDHLLALSRRGQVEVAVMFIDLDHFKKINDSLGHQIGDQLLIEAASRLKKLLRETDVVARLGGDEFVVVLAQHDTADQVSALAARIVSRLSESYFLAGHKLHSGGSIGISLFPADGADRNTLLRNADAAMYVAKQKGRGNYQFFSSELNAAAHARLQIENQILSGLERQEFELFFQPQIHLSSRQVIGAEALLRWSHPQMGMIPPDRFIPIAEESGLILPLGDWVLERALHVLAGWQQGPLANLRLAVNLSARQCHAGTILHSIDRLQQETGVDLRGLEIEITETAAMQDPEQTRELLRQMRSRGIKVAIDDFGTGYSSLSYLKLFAIDRIKIDRSFVKDIEKDQNDALIASATIALAHTLGLDVIAEGVETEGQCAFLNHELCDEGQGYLFGRPMPLADFEKFAAAEAVSLDTLSPVTSGW